MRERLVAAFVGLAILVLVVFGVVRAYAIGNLVQEHEQRSVEQAVHLIVDVIDERESAGRPVTAGYLRGLVNPTERLQYTAPAGAEVDTAAGVDAGAEVDAGDPATIRRSEPLGDGRSVTLSRSGDLVERRVADQLLPIVLLGIIMVAVAALLGYLAAVWLSRPFQDLARLAGELGRGRFDLDIPSYSIPEAEAVGTAMRDSAARLDELVRREREFAANASHQLRTPITALRLELEDLSMWPATPSPVAAQLDRAVAEVDRLSSTVNDLLDLARGRRLGVLSDISLSGLVADTVERWRPLAVAAGRRIEYDERDEVVVRLAAGPITQILDVLIENAIKHGFGTVTVDIAEPDHYVRVSVRDEGRKTIVNDIFRRHVQSVTSSGEGIGLAVASEMAEALGGHLALDPGDQTTFGLMLPSSSVSV